MAEDNYLFKTVLIGDSGVGKTDFRSRLCNEEIDSPSYSTFRSTIGFEVRVRRIQVNRKKCTVHIWDTPGKERFHSIVSSAFRGAHGIFILYDVTDLTSFQSVSRWLDVVKKCADESVQLVLLGNKCEMKDSRAVPREHGEAFALRNGLKFFEISTQERTNVERSLHDMVEATLQMENARGDIFDFTLTRTKIKCGDCCDTCIVQ